MGEKILRDKSDRRPVRGKRRIRQITRPGQTSPPGLATLTTVGAEEDWEQRDSSRSIKARRSYSGVACLPVTRGDVQRSRLGQNLGYEGEIRSRKSSLQSRLCVQRQKTQSAPQGGVRRLREGLVSKIQSMESSTHIPKTQKNTRGRDRDSFLGS